MRRQSHLLYGAAIGAILLSGAPFRALPAGADIAAAKPRIIDVEMSDAHGFSPRQVTARVGDVVRFTVRTGRHNVHFLPDSNPGRTFLPPAGELLSTPGSTYEVKVGKEFRRGTYFFQCDPHARGGMNGHLIVRK